MFKLSETISWGGINSITALVSSSNSFLVLSENAREKVLDAADVARGKWLVAICCFPDNQPISKGKFDMLTDHLDFIAEREAYPLAVICRAGQERSMAVAAYAHARITGCSWDDAVAAVKALRPDGMRHTELQESFAGLARAALAPSPVSD